MKIYKYKILEEKETINKTDKFYIKNNIYNLNEINENFNDFYFFLRQLENKQKRKIIIESNLIGLNKNKDFDTLINLNKFKNLNISFLKFKNKKEEIKEIKDKYNQFLLDKKEGTLKNNKNEIIGEENLYKLLLTNNDTHYIIMEFYLEEPKINYKLNKKNYKNKKSLYLANKEYKKEKKKIKTLIKKLQRINLLGKKIIKGKQNNQDYFYNNYIVFKYLAKEKQIEYKKYFINVEKIGYKEIDLNYQDENKLLKRINFEKKSQEMICFNYKNNDFINENIDLDDKEENVFFVLEFDFPSYEFSKIWQRN